MGLIQLQSLGFQPEWLTYKSEHQLPWQGTTTGAMYGDGTYFARDASYSLDFACTIASGQKQLLVAEVCADGVGIDVIGG
jgi:hypothetical protein